MIKLNDDIFLSNEQYEIKITNNRLYNLDKIREDIIGPDYKMGEINFETPISKFLKYNLNKDIHSYVHHKEIYLLERKEKLILFILKDMLVITDKIESEGFDRCDTISSNLSNSTLTTYSNSVLIKIEYKTIYNYDYEIKENSRNLILKLIRSDNFSTFSNLVISFRSNRDLFIIRHFIDTYKTIAWQNFFESYVSIQKPLIYQNHFFLQKINKRGKSQSRVITFTNKFILNIPFKLICKDLNYSFELDSTKWALAIESIKSLTIYKKKSLTIKLAIDKAINTKIADLFKLKSKGKKELEFLFYYEIDMRKFIFLCRNIFYTLKKSFLLINIS